MDLFERHHGCVQLTPAGRRFLGSAQRLIDLSDAATLTAQQERTTGALRIGIYPASAAELTRPLLIELKRLWPAVDLDIVALDLVEWAPTIDGIDATIMRGSERRPPGARNPAVQRVNARRDSLELASPRSDPPDYRRGSGPTHRPTSGLSACGTAGVLVSGAPTQRGSDRLSRLRRCLCRRHRRRHRLQPRSRSHDQIPTPRNQRDPLQQRSPSTRAPTPGPGSQLVSKTTGRSSTRSIERSPRSPDASAPSSFPSWHTTASSGRIRPSEPTIKPLVG